MIIVDFDGHYYKARECLLKPRGRSERSPALPAHDVVQVLPAPLSAPPRLGVFEQRIAERHDQVHVSVAGKAKQGASLLGLPHGAEAGDHAKLPCGELHAGGGLSCIEEDRLLLRRRWGDQRHAERRIRDVGDIRAGPCQRSERGAIADCEEVPRLVVPGRICALSFRAV